MLSKISLSGKGILYDFHNGLEYSKIFSNDRDVSGTSICIC